MQSITNSGKHVHGDRVRAANCGMIEAVTEEEGAQTL